MSAFSASIKGVQVLRTDVKLTPAEIEAIESVLAKDQRVMLIPTKDKVKIVRVRHDEVKIGAKAQYLTEY